jgi:hypothetical protein
MLYKYLGIQADVNEISSMEKFCRKKYMGVLRQTSNKVRDIMVRFPVILSMYMKNRKTKIGI